MDRPRQDDNRYLENGVFSGAAGGGVDGSAGGESRGRGPYYGNGIPSGTGNRGAAGRPLYPNGARFPVCPCDNCIYSRQSRAGKENITHDSSRDTSALVAAITLMAVLFLAFLFTVFAVVCLVLWKGGPAGGGRKTGKQDYDFSFQETTPSGSQLPDSSGTGGSGTDGAQNGGAERQDKEKGPVLPEESKKEPYVGEGEPDNGKYYGELKDVVRTDLSYSVEWKNYEFEGNNEYVMLAVDYPVVRGDMPNLDAVNEILAQETSYFEEYYEEYSKYMLEGETFAVYAEGFVTFMDEKTLSVVFEEQIYTDYWTDHGLFCINIDVEDGVVLDNSSILKVDDAFAVDFRIRSREQNGSDAALDYMTDQEIAYYLTSAGSSILFYTPLGMEVGINYGESYVTVTYSDYEQYIQRY